MFTIYGGKTEFKQWEQGQRVTNPKLAVGDKVRFWNQSGETHPMIAYKHEGVVVADVPNDLLQHCSPILVELCGDPECMCRFLVTAQDKPDGYVFIDNTHCEPAVPSGGGGGVTDYNKLENRPCGLEFTGTVLLQEVIEYQGAATYPKTIGFIVGETYTVVCDGKLYETQAFELETEGMKVGVALAFGNFIAGDVYAEYQEAVGAPAMIQGGSDDALVRHDITIAHGTAIVKPLNPVLLPRLDVIITRENDNSHTINKSFDEVHMALTSGYDVKVALTANNYSYVNLSLVCWDPNSIEFTAYTTGKTLHNYYAVLKSDDTIEVDLI